MQYHPGYIEIIYQEHCRLTRGLSITLPGIELNGSDSSETGTELHLESLVKHPDVMGCEMLC